VAGYPGKKNLIGCDTRQIRPVFLTFHLHNEHDKGVRMVKGVHKSPNNRGTGLKSFLAILWYAIEVYVHPIEHKFVL